MKLTRRKFVGGIASSAGVVLTQLKHAPASQVSAPSRPNVIFILADDLGWGDLSCYGRPDYRTPNLDRLASRGIRFDRAYVNSPVCTPSRQSIITGRLPHAAGVTLLRTPLSEQQLTVAEHLRRRWPDDGPRLLLSSFERAALASAAQAAPNIPRGLLAENLPEDWETALGELGCATLHLDHARLDASKVRELTELGVPLLCDFDRVTSVQIFVGLKDIGQNPFVYGLVTVALVVTVGLYGLSRLLLRKMDVTAGTKGATRRERLALRGAARWLCTGFALAVLVAAALPIGANVLLFSQRYRTAEELVTASVAVSTALAVFTVSVVMALASGL